VTAPQLYPIRQLVPHLFAIPPIISRQAATARRLLEGVRQLQLDGQPLKEKPDVTDQEKQKAEELISRLETSVGQMFPRDGGNAALITAMIQSLNGLRSLLGVVRPH
jgi:hypothetical protein